MIKTQAAQRLAITSAVEEKTFPVIESLRKLLGAKKVVFTKGDGLDSEYSYTIRATKYEGLDVIGWVVLNPKGKLLDGEIVCTSKDGTDKILLMHDLKKSKKELQADIKEAQSVIDACNVLLSLAP